MTPEDMRARGSNYLEGADFLFQSGREELKAEAWNGVKVATMLIVAADVCEHLIELNKTLKEVAQGGREEVAADDPGF